MSRDNCSSLWSEPRCSHLDNAALIGLPSLAAHSSQISTSQYHVLDALPAQGPFVSSSAFSDVFLQRHPQCFRAPFPELLFPLAFIAICCFLFMYIFVVLASSYWNVRPMKSEIFLGHCD